MGNSLDGCKNAMGYGHPAAGGDMLPKKEGTPPVAVEMPNPEADYKVLRSMVYYREPEYEAQLPTTPQTVRPLLVSALPRPFASIVTGELYLT